jgi:predicted transcriptional regulator of viral defense system
MAMKHYKLLLSLGCFTWMELCQTVGGETAAHTLAYRYMKQGYIARVRRGLYVALDLLSKSSSVSKYRIASKVSPTSYVSHHSAFEYYGYANQVAYTVNVSSETPFADFVFEGVTYSHLASRLAEGISVMDGGVRITDRERTIIDGINDFEKVMGLEELLRCLALMPPVDENRLLTCLEIYGKQVLYQKSGYLLSHFASGLGLSDRFFATCAASVGRSKRYLLRDRPAHGMIYNDTWRLVVPESLMHLTEGGYEDAAI